VLELFASVLPVVVPPEPDALADALVDVLADAELLGEADGLPLAESLGDPAAEVLGDAPPLPDAPALPLGVVVDGVPHAARMPRINTRRMNTLTRRCIKILL
jgi:hypothetical protein